MHICSSTHFGVMQHKRMQLFQLSLNLLQPFSGQVTFKSIIKGVRFSCRTPTLSRLQQCGRMQGMVITVWSAYRLESNFVLLYLNWHPSSLSITCSIDFKLQNQIQNNDLLQMLFKQLPPPNPVSLSLFPHYHRVFDVTSINYCHIFLHVAYENHAMCFKSSLYLIPKPL